MKHFMSFLVGLALAIGVAQMPAQAATINLGNIAPGSSSSGFGGAFGVMTFPNIADTVQFHLTADSTISGNIADIPFAIGPFTFLSASGFTVSLNGVTSLTVDGSGNFSYGGLLTAGDYFLDIGGITTGIFGGGYQISVAAVAATPIPAALLLFLTALGGLGAVTWRRRSTGGAPSLA